MERERPLRSGNRIDNVQVQHWLVERERSRRRELNERAVPVITVSREQGTPGAAIGRIVAQRLGFRFWERDVMDAPDDVRALAIVASTLAARGGAVMVGRRLGTLLSPARALRVRVVCPLEPRAHEHRTDLDDVSGYDLWVSTGSLSPDAAAAVIIAGYRYRFGEKVMRAISARRASTG